MLNVNNAQYEQINDPLSSEEEDKKRNSHNNNNAGIKMICEDEANLFQLFYFCWIVPMLRIGFGLKKQALTQIRAGIARTRIMFSMNNRYQTQPDAEGVPNEAHLPSSNQYTRLFVHQ